MRFLLVFLLLTPIAPLSAQLIMPASGLPEGSVTEKEPALAWSATMDFPDKFFLMHFPQGKSYSGLFPTEIDGTYELRPLSTEIRGHRLRLNEIVPPVWVFADRFTGPPQITRGTELDTVLAPDDRVVLREGSLYATDKSKIGYALWIQLNDGRRELLLRTESACRVEVNFVGDLDGDWKDDIVLTLQRSDSEWYYGLLTTRDAPPGKRFRSALLRPVFY